MLLACLKICEKKFCDLSLWQTLLISKLLLIKIYFFFTHINVNALFFRILLQWNHAGLADTLLCVHLPGVHCQTREPSGWWTAWNHRSMSGNHPRVHCLWSCKLPLTFCKEHWSNYRFPPIGDFRKNGICLMFHMGISIILQKEKFLRHLCSMIVFHVPSPFYMYNYLYMSKKFFVWECRQKRNFCKTLLMHV